MLKLFIIVAATAPFTAGHAAVTHPKPRQAIDGTLAPWNGSVPDPVPFDTPNWCAHSPALEGATFRMAEPTPISYIPGCTCASAMNYDWSATMDDGSCEVPKVECPTLDVFDPLDGQALMEIAGCTFAGAMNYDSSATLHDGSCEMPFSFEGSTPASTPLLEPLLCDVAGVYLVACTILFFTLTPCGITRRFALWSRSLRSASLGLRRFLVLTVLFGCIVTASAFSRAKSDPPAEGKSKTSHEDVVSHADEYSPHDMSVSNVSPTFPFLTHTEAVSPHSALVLPSTHSRRLQTVVACCSGTDIQTALNNPSISQIVLQGGTYTVSSQLQITRSITIEAAQPGSVVLDAQASSGSQRRVLYIRFTPANALDVVELTGINITGGFLTSVSVRFSAADSWPATSRNFHPRPQLTVVLTVCRRL